MQEFKETWSDHDAISLLPKCNHFKSATTRYPLLRRLADEQLQHTIWMAYQIGGKQEAEKFTTHIRRACATRTYPPRLGMKTITLLQTPTGNHQGLAHDLIRRLEPLWQPYRWIVTIRPAPPKTLAKHLQNHHQIQHNTRDEDLVCTCGELRRVTGLDPHKGKNGHCWLRLSEAVTRAETDTEFSRLRKRWKCADRQEDFTSKVNIVHSNNQAAEWIADQVFHLAQTAGKEKGKRTRPGPWKELHEALHHYAGEYVTTCRSTDPRGIQLQDVPKWIQKKSSCSALDKIPWDMRISCPILDRCDTIAVLQETHEQIAAELPTPHHPNR